MATGKQIQCIYALGAKCGLLDRFRGADDDLHLWIKQLSLKDHISELTEKQADFIIGRLEDYRANVCPPRIAEVEGITEEQKKYCFRLMYKLAEISPSEAGVRERLRGIVSKCVGKEIRVDGDIFYKVSRGQGAQIIEMLKRLIRSEERKRGDKNGTGTVGKAQPP